MYPGILRIGIRPGTPRVVVVYMANSLRKHPEIAEILIIP